MGFSIPDLGHERTNISGSHSRYFLTRYMGAHYSRENVGQKGDWEGVLGAVIQ
jgi:hypothetical protein